MKSAAASGFSVQLGCYIAGLFALVLVPFFLLEQYSFELSTRLLLDSRSHQALFALVVIGLALDVFLPLPSTVIAATGAAILGGVPGFIAVWAGLSAGCVLGYEFGASAGEASLRKMVSDAQQRRLAWLQGYFGMGALVLCRPVPVLAEVSVLLAGSGRVPRPRFYSLCLLANILVAALYTSLTEPLFTTLAATG